MHGTVHFAFGSDADRAIGKDAVHIKNKGGYLVEVFFITFFHIQPPAQAGVSLVNYRFQYNLNIIVFIFSINEKTNQKNLGLRNLI